MKQPKLYTKNEKGRYEEYQIPDMDVSETLFREKVARNPTILIVG